MKTPGGKPFALATWDCGIISTAAIRSRRRQQEVGRLVRKNRTSVDSDSVIRCCPRLSLSRHQVRPAALLQSHRGRQSHRCDRDHSPRCARGKHTEGGRLPQEKPGWRCGRMGLRTLPRPGDNHSLSARRTCHLSSFETCFENLQGTTGVGKTRPIWIPGSKPWPAEPTIPRGAAEGVPKVLKPQLSLPRLHVLAWGPRSVPEPLLNCRAVREILCKRESDHSSVLPLGFWALKLKP